MSLSLGAKRQKEMLAKSAEGMASPENVISRVNSDPAIKWRDAHSDYRLSLTAFTKSGRNGTSVDFAGLRKGKKVNIIPSRRRKIESREARYILE